MAITLNDNPNLFSLLFGGGQSPVQQVPADPQPQQAPPPPPQEAPIEVNGFAQTHRSWLGKLADAINVAYDGEPIYENRMRERDVARAMKGFATDPLTAIARLAQIPGQADKAASLYDRYDDNRRLQENTDRANNLYDLKRQELGWNRIAGMMRGANEKTWSAMRDLAIKLGPTYGIDAESVVPTTYDPDSVDYINAGSIKPIDAAKLDETHGYHENIIDTRKRGQDIMHGDRIRGQDIVHQDKVMNEQGRMDRHSTPRPAVARPQASSVMTKYGPGIISRDGTKMMVQRGGKTYGYVNTGKANGQINWTPIGEITTK